jgi:glucose-6-phosphate 1-dehydrogenase
VLEAWRIVDPIVTQEAIRQGALFVYEPGTAGPASADALVADHGGWHTPAPT